MSPGCHPVPGHCGNMNHHPEGPLGHISWFPVLSSVGIRPAGSPRGGRSVAMAGRSLRQLGTGSASPASIQRPIPSKGYEQKQRESWLRVVISCTIID